MMRQKHIKIADRSELGCKVVEEYEANELALRSEAEKKLERAERTAERKAVKKRKGDREAGAQELYREIPTAAPWSECTGDVMAQESEPSNNTSASKEFSAGD